MGSPFLYFADERLSLAELSAARLDGDVVEVGDAYMPADAVETVALRAGSLSGTLGTTLAATHLSAAWVHGAITDPPVRHTVQRAVSRRIPHHPTPRVVYRDLAIDPRDLERRGGVAVTTRLRTLIDLSRVPDAAHRAATTAMARLVGAEMVEQAISRLEAGALPHKRAATELLRHLVGDSPVVRTT